MKKYIYIALALSLGTFSGCSDFLEIDPIAQETEVGFYATPENCTYAVNAIYDVIGQAEGKDANGTWLKHSYEFFFNDILSYDVEKGSSETDDGPEIQPLAEWRATSTSLSCVSFWTKAFDGINRCNTLLKYLDEATFDPAVVAKLKGQTYFLKGYFYFNLVRIFGGVPIMDKLISADQIGKLQRASLHDTYNYAASQFQLAIPLLPLKNEYASADLGRATKGAAQGYLARLKAYQIGVDINNTSSWQEVYDLTKAVMESGQYSLMGNYAEIFEEAGENGVESVFELQYMENGAAEEPAFTGTLYSVFTNSRGGWGWGFQQPTQNLYDAYDQQDPRLYSTICGPTVNNGIVHGVKNKYKLGEMMTPFHNRKSQLAAKPATDKNSGYNVRMMRYAEIIFLRAEAAIHLGALAEAEDLVELVNARARVSTYPKGWREGQATTYEATGWNGNLPRVAIAGLTQEDAILKLMAEKRKEFACEFINYYDLVRTNQYLSVLDTKQANSRYYGESGYGELRYASVNLRQNCLEKCIDGPNGVKVPLLPIPLSEVQSYGLTQNKGY